MPNRPNKPRTWLEMVPEEDDTEKLTPPSLVTEKKKEHANTLTSKGSSSPCRITHGFFNEPTGRPTEALKHIAQEIAKEEEYPPWLKALANKVS